MELFLDTETSGKFNFKSDYKSAGQPWVCQIAMVLSNAEQIHAQMCFLIESDGRKISPGAYNVHKISTGMCDKYGISEMTSCYIFLEALLRCDTIVCHNVKFDVAMVCHMLYNNNFIGEAEFLLSYDSYCTMEEGACITKLPGKYGQYKWPSLSELYRYLFAEDFEGAHDALVDVKATRKCYYAIVKGG